MFDPDYRFHPWNKSRFTPKNSGNRNAITRIALMWSMVTALVMGGAAYTLLPRQQITAAFIGVGIVAFGVFMVMGVRIHRREKARLYKLYGSPDETLIEDKPRKPATKSNPPTTTAESLPTAHHSSPREFEHEIAWLFNVLTEYKAVVSGGSGDKGADVRILDKEGRLVGIVQCKRYAPDKTLAPTYLRELHSVKLQMGVQHAWLATTARFSADVERESAKLGIELMDGAKVDRMRKKAASKAKSQGV